MLRFEIGRFNKFVNNISCREYILTEYHVFKFTIPLIEHPVFIEAMKKQFLHLLKIAYHFIVI